MVTPGTLERRLAWVLRLGAVLGVGLSLSSVVVLSLLGEPLRPWTLTLSGWWDGGSPVLRGLAGAGLWILAATPLAMLLTYLVAAARGRRRRGLAVALGLLAVYGLGLGLAWAASRLPGA